MKACKVMFVVFAMLLLAVPIVAAQEGWAGCPSGAAYDPMAHGYEPACFSQPAENSAALKPAGLAAPAPAVIQIQDGPVCAPGYYYYIVGPGDQGDCFPESIWTRAQQPPRQPRSLPDWRPRLQSWPWSKAHAA